MRQRSRTTHTRSLILSDCECAPLGLAFMSPLGELVSVQQEDSDLGLLY